MNSELIQQLRKPKLVINEDLSIAVFDLAGAFIPTYLISKYVLNLNSPIFISATLTIPIGYFSHRYFGVASPLNNYIDKRITAYQDQSKLQESQTNGSVII